MKPKTISPEMLDARISRLRSELAQVRQWSMNASRRDDYAAVAQFTTRAAELNREIQQAEDAQIL